MRHPRLKIILVHGGGFLPYIAYRVAELNKKAFDDQSLPSSEILGECRRFYVDTALSASPAALPTTTAFVPHDRILYGSDNPYAPPEVSSVFTAYLDAANLSPKQAAAINRDNAVTLFPRLATKAPLTP
jgi:aminocarboxymuconate-semialdehyde decarboxylase